MPIPGKRKSLALYEVINERGMRDAPGSSNGPATPAPTTRPATPAPAPSEPPRLSISPGQSIRVPVGYLFFTIALVVLVGVAGYTLGYHQHERVVQRRDADEAARMRLSDPLNEDDAAYDSLTMGAPDAGTPSNGSGSGSGSGVAGTPNRETAPPRPRESVPRQGSASSVVVVERGTPDPRRVGLNYVIFARFVSTSSKQDAVAETRAGAIRAAEYVASHGYEVGVYPRQGGRVFTLIALRPFEGTGGDDYKAFTRDLKQIGKRFKAQEDGPVDFADLWAEKFKG